MYPIANRIIFPDNLIFLELDDNQIVVNTNTSSSAKISQENSVLLKKIMDLREHNYDDYISFADTNEQAAKLIKQLIVADVIRMKQSVTKEDTSSKNPTQVYWGITDVCNFKCVYCYADCTISAAEKKPIFLEFEEYKKIIDAIADYNLRIINITGGEPLLYPNIFKIARYAKSKGIVCGILTNGSLIRESDINKFKIFDFIKISLDSHIPKINDKTRGAGTYEKIIRAISLLRKNNIKVDIGSVITRENMNCLSEFITYMHSEFQIKEHILSNHVPLGRGSRSNLSCGYDEIKKCNEVILNTKSALGLDKNNLNSVVQDSFLQLSKKVSCGMGTSEIFIDSTGSIYPCRMTVSPEYRLGSVLEDGFEKSLNNMKAMQKSLHVDNLECKDCNYKYICGGGCRMFHCSQSGSPTINNEEVCELYKDQIKRMIKHRHNKQVIKQSNYISAQ